MKLISRLALLAITVLGTTITGSINASDTEEIFAKLNRYSSISGWGVNSFWIETDKSVVLIDAQLLPEDAKMMASAIKTTGKPLKAVFITHPHPDHFAGLAALKDEFGKFAIYSSQTTADNLEVALQQFLKSGFSTPFGDRVEKRFVGVNKILGHKQQVTIDGLDFIVDDLGAGESENNSVVSVAQKRWLFTGDATMHHTHYYVGEGRPSKVLSQLAYLKKNYADAFFYTGHGEPARASIVDSQISYINTLQKLVAKAIKNRSNLSEDKKHLTNEKRLEVARQVVKQFPALGDFGFNPVQVAAMNLYGVETEMLATTNAESQSGAAQ